MRIICNFSVVMFIIKKNNNLNKRIMYTVISHNLQDDIIGRQKRRVDSRASLRNNF